MKRNPAAGGASWYAVRMLMLASALCGATSFMMYSDIIARSLASVLSPEIDPSYTGGEIAHTFYDPAGDDSGYGGLVYPTHRDFRPGSLDLLRYTVHEPVWGARWQEESEYWQFVLSFASGPAAVRAVRVYIDVDGDASGLTEPRGSGSEGLAFDPSHPWDYAFALSGAEGVFFSADGEIEIPIRASALDGGKTLRIRIPLRDRRLHFLYAAAMTRHYVYVAAWSSWSRDSIMSAGAGAASDRIGGAASSFTPAVFDIASPTKALQEEMLSSFDEENFETARILPIAVSLSGNSGSAQAGGRSRKKDEASPGRSGSSARYDSETAELLRLASIEEERLQREKDRAEWISVKESFDAKSNDVEDLVALAGAAFRADFRAEAEAALDEAFSRGHDSSPAKAYKGALLALKGADAPPLAAVSIIADAYVYLDAAVETAETPAETLAARLCRGNVSLAIPEMVFGKRSQGASDFLAAAAAWRSIDSGNAEDIARCYLRAALCFSDSGKEEEAGTWFREASRLAHESEAAGTPLSAALRHELAVRGF